MSISYPISPMNDFAIKGKLKDIDAVDGSVAPLTTGTVTAFLATANTDTATAADPTLSVAATHIGDGVWLAIFPGSVLTPTLMDAQFASTPPVLFMQQAGKVRVSTVLTYVAARPATVG